MEKRVEARPTLDAVSFLRRRVADTLATRIDRAYFGEVRRLVPSGLLRTADAKGVIEAHRLAWDVVCAEVFDGSRPAVMFGSRQSAIKHERAQLMELATLYGVPIDELDAITAAREERPRPNEGRSDVG